jgi:mRNA-degrading endonuclease YafQ of YafQ-DinJ toxin-antitoxin module
MYNLEYDKDFKKSFKKVIGKDVILIKKLKHALNTLINNPKNPGLRTHKVDTILETDVYSSWVTGDIRIIWRFDENNIATILCVRLGKHNGMNQVYKNKSN